MDLAEEQRLVHMGPGRKDGIGGQIYAAVEAAIVYFEQIGRGHFLEGLKPLHKVEIIFARERADEGEVQSN
jgi:hypothetical protein